FERAEAGGRLDVERAVVLAEVRADVQRTGDRADGRVEERQVRIQDDVEGEAVQQVVFGADALRPANGGALQHRGDHRGEHLHVFGRHRVFAFAGHAHRYADDGRLEQR